MNCKCAQNTFVNYVSYDPISLEIIIILNFRYRVLCNLRCQYTVVI